MTDYKRRPAATFRHSSRLILPLHPTSMTPVLGHATSVRSFFIVRYSMPPGSTRLTRTFRLGAYSGKKLEQQ